ncbi:hypothetical protein ACFL3T_02005 [Patescibacteria group bacterium]
MASRAATTRAPRSRVTSEQTKEILKFTQSRKALYPEINSVDDLKDKKYGDLMRPLKKKPEAMPKYAKKFFGRLTKLEGYLQNVALNNFTYASAKSIAKPAEKPLFAKLENSINTITAANVTRTGGITTYLPRPQLNTLFSALSMNDFKRNLNNVNIVNAKFALDRDFKAAATAVMQHIIKYRRDHAQKLKEESVYAYLDEIFSTSEDKIDDTIDKSKIINMALITQSTRARINKGWHEYQAYRDQLDKRLKLEAIVNKEKQTIFSKPVEYARSGGRFIAQQIQKFRANWAGMDGKERVVAGATLLVGLAWFLNSDNEEAGKLREALKKAGMIGIGYIALNTTAKAFTGRTLTASLSNRLDDMSGKRDLLKDSFNTNREGAEILSYSIAYIGNYNFSEVGNMYMDQQNLYNDPSNTIPDNLKELPIGGVAQDEMNANQLYRAVRLVDNKLKKQGSSIEQVLWAIEEMKAKAKAEGKSFTEPTFAMIVAAILMNQDVKFKIDKEGRIEMVKTTPFDVKWTPTDRDYTENWWTFTGKPHEWKDQIDGKFPGKKIKVDNLKRISKDIMAESRPLDKYITTERFGRYTKGFKDLNNLEIKNKPGQNVHTLVTTEGVGYMSSLVNINPNLKSKNMAYIAAYKSAYEIGLRAFEQDLLKNNPSLHTKLKGRFKEFFHIVGAVALAPSKKKKGVATPSKKPNKLRLFFRYVLPNTKKTSGSQEFALRYNKEWPQGDMLQQMKESILKPGETLTRGDFNTIARETVVRQKSLFSLPIYDGYDSKFAGAYESFLSRVGLKKSENAKIDKVLKFYSIKFANSGLTKRGLIRYLATHRFTTAEIKEALGLAATAPLIHFGYIVPSVRKRTKQVLSMAAMGGGILPPRVKDIFKNIDLNKRNSIERDIYAKYGTIFILACYGDLAALKVLEKSNKKAHDAIVAEFGINKSTGQVSKSPNKNTFETKVLNHYLIGILEAFADDKKRPLAAKAVGAYLATY